MVQKDHTKYYDASKPESNNKHDTSPTNHHPGRSHQHIEIVKMHHVSMNPHRKHNKIAEHKTCTTKSIDLQIQHHDNLAAGTESNILTAVSSYSTPLPKQTAPTPTASIRNSSASINPVARNAPAAVACKRPYRGLARKIPLAISRPARSAARDLRPPHHPPPLLVGILTLQGLTAGDLRSPLHEATQPPPVTAQRNIFLTVVTVPAIADHHHHRKLQLYN